MPAGLAGEDLGQSILLTLVCLFVHVDRLCDKLDQRRTALDRQNLLLDRIRETPGRTYERVQRFPGECRRDQAERNDYPKHEAIISDAVARRQLRVEVAEVCPICSEEAIFGRLDWT